MLNPRRAGFSSKKKKSVSESLYEIYILTTRSSSTRTYDILSSFSSSSCECDCASPHERKHPTVGPSYCPSARRIRSVTTRQSSPRASSGKEHPQLLRVVCVTETLLFSSFVQMSALSAVSAAAHTAASLRSVRAAKASKARGMSSVVKASVLEPVSTPQALSSVHIRNPRDASASSPAFIPSPSFFIRVFFF